MVYVPPTATEATKSVLKNSIERMEWESAALENKIAGMRIALTELERQEDIEKRRLENEAKIREA